MPDPHYSKPALGKSVPNLPRDARNGQKIVEAGGKVTRGGCRSGPFSGRVQNQAAKCKTSLKNARNRRRKSGEKLTNPADFALGVGGYFLVESRGDSREIVTTPLKIDVKNQAGAGKRPRRSDLANRALTGTFPKPGSAGPRKIRLKPENAPRTRFSAVGRQIQAAFCKSCLTLDKIVGRAPSPGGPAPRPRSGRLSAPNLEANFVV